MQIKRLFQYLQSQQIMLVDYSSSEEEAEDIIEGKCTKSPSPKNLNSGKLPSAVDLLGGITKNTDEDISKDHDGRIRNFAHERGNWATFCCIPFPLTEGILNLQEHIKDFTMKNLSLELIEAREIHVSLTKTVVLKHHWIDPFIASLQQKLQNTRKFPLHLNSLKIYCNEERTRTFIGLTTSEEIFTYLRNLVGKCDEALKEFNLECFYRDMSFHVSILWIVGDHQEKLEEAEEILQEDFLKFLGLNLNDFAIQVEKIICKSGNKMYQFALS